MSRQTAEPLLDQAQRIHRLLVAIPFSETSERDLVRRALLLANDDCSDAEKTEALMFYSLLTHGLPSDSGARFARTYAKEAQAFVRKAWDTLSSERERMREAVNLVMSDREAARKRLGHRIQEAVQGIILIPSISWDGHRLATAHRYFALSVSAMCGYALALLLDEERPLADALKRCALPKCETMFLSLPSAKGGRPALYCRRDHQAIAAALTGQDRTQRWRDRQARKPK